MEIKPKRMLAILAHPDDESYAISGTLARYAYMGVQVVLFCATRGEAGILGMDREEAGKIREGELRNAAQHPEIGLLPDIPRERIRFLGNISLAAARATLTSCQSWRRAGKIASSTSCLELTAESRYFDEHMAALFLPHTDLSLFPSIKSGETNV